MDNNSPTAAKVGPLEAPPAGKRNAAAMLALTDAVNKLTGEVAALVAYIATTTKPLDARGLSAAKTMAQRLSPPSLGSLRESAPALNAARTIDRIQTMANSIAAVRRS